MKSDTVTFLIKQIANLVDTDFPLVPGFKNIAKDIKNIRIKTIMKEIAEEIQKGKSLSDAISKFPEIFPSFFISMVKIGEISGNLGNILNNLAVYTGKLNKFYKKIREVTIYPIILLFVTIIVITVIFLKFIPVFKSMLEDISSGTGTSLSLFFIEKYFFILIFFPVFLSLLLFFFLKGKSEVSEKIKLNFPVYGKIFQYATLSRFSKNLSILLKSGLPFTESVKLAGVSSGSIQVEKATGEIIEKVSSGNKWDDVFEKYPIFPNTFIWMIRNGEEKGELPEILTSLSDFYEEEFDRQVEIFIHFVEPLIILFVGVLIGISVILIFRIIYGPLINAMWLFRIN